MDSDEEFFMSTNTYNVFFAKKEGIHEINKNREKGEFHSLYHELRKHPEKFFNYSRMSIETFDYILLKIQCKLEKRWTNFITNPIVPCEKLIITLR